MSLRSEIVAALTGWDKEINYFLQPKILALNFGLQKTYNGFEVYLEGFTWFDETSEIWLFDEQWSPEMNYILVENNSVPMDLTSALELYRGIICKLINTGELRIPVAVEMITVCLSSGQPIRIK